MKFVKFGNWNVRADRIVAVNYCATAQTITVYCGPDEKYQMHYANEKSTATDYLNLMNELKSA